MSQVDLILHYRYGTTVREAKLSNIHRQDAERLVNSIGDLRPTDGVVTISTPGGIDSMIPARGIDFAQIKERT